MSSLVKMMGGDGTKTLQPSHTWPSLDSGYPESNHGFKDGYWVSLTPAIAAGVTDKLWEMSDMVQVIEDWGAKREANKKLTATGEQGAWKTRRAAIWTTTFSAR